MPTYNAKCPKCGSEQEYFCSMSEREAGEGLPWCSQVLVNEADPTDEQVCNTQMEKAFTSNNQGGFVLKGRGWFKTGGY